MYTSNILVSFLSVSAFARNTANTDDIFPAPLFGYSSNLDNIQASAVSFSGDNGVLTLSCGDSNCPLKPSPTLTLGESEYRLVLGTVATQTCMPTSDGTNDTGLTAICVESTSGVDTASRTVTYSSADVHYATVTITGGLDIFSSALSGYNETHTRTRNPATRSRTPDDGNSTMSTVSSSIGSSITSLPSTTPISALATSSATSSTATPGSAAGLTVSKGAGLAGALVGAFAWLFL